jgi:hypothetical protein
VYTCAVLEVKRRFRVKNAGTRQPPPIAAPLLYGGAIVIVLVVHLATNGMLGFHTDELYYIDSGRHPALGYVDFPSIVPLLARLETDLPADSWSPSQVCTYGALAARSVCRRLPS